MEKQESVKAEQQLGRLVSLDAFRGLTILAMILVNNPGSWSHIYSPLQHANWHGWTPTDLIFPFFPLYCRYFVVVFAAEVSQNRADRPYRLWAHPPPHGCVDAIGIITQSIGTVVSLSF